MSTNKHQKMAQRKRRIAHRLRPIHWSVQARPMYTASNIHYDVSTRTRAITAGGIGALHLLALQTGLVDTLDREVQVLKRHLPYHESDHILGVAYNVLSGGTCLQDIEQRRQDEVYLDALVLLCHKLTGPSHHGTVPPWDMVRTRRPSDSRRT